MRLLCTSLFFAVLVPSVAFADGDGDGYNPPADCNDGDAAVHPGAPELCNGQDDDCVSFMTPDGPSWLVNETDIDSDGYVKCTPWVGPPPSQAGGDCGPANASVNPSASELCDGVDTDCDGTLPPSEGDLDGDGIPDCADSDRDGDGSSNSADCRPDDASAFPGAPEACNGLDDDCDGQVPSDESDPDHDGILSCLDADDDGDGTADGSDCAPLDPLSYPGAPELCDARDNDCDGSPAMPEFDFDLDGWIACYPWQGGGFPPGILGAGDCVDGDASIHPWAPEVCNQIDDDCDRLADFGASTVGDQIATGSSNSLASSDLVGNAYFVPVGLGLSEFTAKIAPPGQPVDVWFYVQCVSGCTGNPALYQSPGPITVPPATGLLASGPLGIYLAPGGSYFLGIRVAQGASYRGASSPSLNTATLQLPGAGLAGPVATSLAADGFVVEQTLTVLSLPEMDQDLDGFIGCGPNRDCNPKNPAVFPGALESCDSTDSDCDGSLVDGFMDTDSDGQPNCVDPDDDNDGFADGGWPDFGPDCGNEDPQVYPGAPEACDSTDSDCDDDLVDGFPNLDGDGEPDCVDLDDDGDGTPDAADCEPYNPAVFPGAPEACDTVDSDCNGDFVDGFPNMDGDGEPDCSDANIDGDPEPNATDCEPLDPSSWPGAPELCDGADNDCDALLPEWETDLDGDAWMPCEGDCAPSDPGVHPQAPEQCNGIDDDCDGAAGAGATPVEDFVGWPSTDSWVARFVSLVYTATESRVLVGFAQEFDPLANSEAMFVAYEHVESFPGGPLVWQLLASRVVPVQPWAGFEAVEFPAGVPLDPGGEYLLGVATSSDALYRTTDAFAETPTDFGFAQVAAFGSASGSSYPPDPNAYPPYSIVGDGVPQGLLTTVETEIDADGDGYLACGGDCDDGNATVGPAANEVCNGEDDDCDGVVPAAEIDGDADGLTTCNGDCDDAVASAYPGAPELCDGVDNDCDSLLPPSEEDVDLDGVAECAGDCDDGNSAVSPSVPETCDTLDQDCDGAVDENWDADGDGVPAAAWVTECAVWTALDCDDASPVVYPGAAESCDSTDSDCDASLVDSFANTDLDGLPDCVDPDDDGDGSADAADCASLEAAIYPGAPESCDWVDSDCDGDLVDGFPNSDPAEATDGYPDCIVPPWVSYSSAGYSFAHGVIEDPDGDPVPGASVSFVLEDPADAAPQVSTDGTGAFHAPVAPSDTEERWLLQVTAPGFTEAWRHVVVSQIEERTLPPIVVTPLDPATQVQPNAAGDVTVASSDGRYEVVFPAGVVTTPLSVNVTPLDDGLQLGYPLPKSSIFTYAVHLHVDPPAAAPFSQQLTVRVRNDRGFAEGTQIPVGWFNEEAARWVHMTEGEVLDGAQWIAFPTEHFSFFDINFPAESAPGDGLADLEAGGDEDVACGFSSVGLYHQNLQETISLPTYGVLGGRYGVELGYDSARARPQPSVRLKIDGSFGDPNAPSPPDEVLFWAGFGGQSAEGQWEGPGPETMVLKAAFEGASATTLEDSPSDPYLPTGFYDIDWQAGFYYENVGYALAEAFAAPGSSLNTNVAINGPNTFWRTGRQRDLLVNGRGSPFGAGWGIAGLRELQFDSYGAGQYRTIGLVDGGGDTGTFYRGHAEVFAGTGASSNSSFPAGNPPTTVSLGHPRGVAIGPDGTTYIADEGKDCILRATEISPDSWQLDPFAGSCGSEASSAQADGPASTPLKDPAGLAMAPAGDWVYFVEEGFRCVRRTDGISIETVAGQCRDTATSPDPYHPFEPGAPEADRVAAGHDLNPQAIVLASDVDLYVADTSSGGGTPWEGRILHVDLVSGIAETVAGDPTRSPAWLATLLLCGTGNPFCGLLPMPDLPIRRRLPLHDPAALAILHDGTGPDPFTLLVLDRDASANATTNAGSVVYEVRLDGDADEQDWNVFAGSGHPFGSPMGAEAADLPMAGADGLAVDPWTGFVYVGVGPRVIEIDSDLRVRSFLGTGEAGYSGEDGPALRAKLFESDGIALDADGRVLVVDDAGDRVWRVDPDIWWGSSPEGSAWLVDEGSGAWTLHTGAGQTEVYEQTGDVARIVEALDAGLVPQTGSPVQQSGFTFDYSSEGLLESITDPTGRATTFAYSGGHLASITDASGRTTSFSVIAGELRSVEFPDGGTWQFTYDDGVLQSKVDPQNATTTYVTDDWRRVTAVRLPNPTDGAPAGGPETTWAGAWSLGLAVPDEWSGPPAAPLLLADDETTVTTPGGFEYVYQFGGDGRVAWAQDPDGRTWTFEYDDDALQATIQSAAQTASPSVGDRTVLDFDLRGRVTEVREYGFDGVTSLRSAYTYNDENQVTTLRTPLIEDDEPPYEFEYDGATSRLEVRRWDGNSASYGPAALWTYSWNADGTLGQTVDPEGVQENFSYDPVTGNVWQQWLGGDTSQLWTYTYDSRGDVDTVTDPEGRFRDYDHDAMGRVVHEEDAAGEGRSYGYSAGACPTCAGNLLSYVIDESGATLGFEYDYLDRPTRRAWPQAPNSDDPSNTAEPHDDGDEEYVYDPATQRLAAATDRNGIRREYGYQPGGALDWVEVWDTSMVPDTLVETIDAGYDGAGRPIILSDGTTSTAWTWDAWGRADLASSANTLGLPSLTADHQFDSRGRIDFVAVNSAADQVDRDFGYNNAASGFRDVPESLGRNGPTPPVHFTWTLSGRPQSVYGDADSVHCYDWDASGRLTAVSHQENANCSSPGDNHLLEYELDDSGALMGITSSWPQSSASILSGDIDTDDSLRALSIAGNYFSFGDEAYVYDAVGNRDPALNTYDARQRVETTADYWFVYDDAGALLERHSFAACESGDEDADGVPDECALTSYVWTPLGELAEVHVENPVDPSAVSDAYFTYDVLGRVIESDIDGLVHTYTYIGDHIEAMRDAAGQIIRRYWYGAGVDMPLAEETASGTWYSYFLLRDGSMEWIRDASGDPIFGATYSPWGKPQGRVQPPSAAPIDVDWPDTALFAFQGRPWFDSIGLSWHRGRWYDPETGRFLSEDPRWPFQPHPYAFGGNNPQEFRDPTGEFAAAIGFEIAGAALDSLNTWVQLNKCLPAGEAYDAWANYSLKLGAITAASMAVPVLCGKAIGAGSRMIPPGAGGGGARFIVSPSGAAVERSVADRWAEGTFGNAVDSAEYHLAKHGAGRTAQQYTDDAVRFFEQNRGQAQWGQWNPNWAPSYRLKVGGQGGYYTADGRVLTFWD